MTTKTLDFWYDLGDKGQWHGRIQGGGGGQGVRTPSP